MNKINIAVTAFNIFLMILLLWSVVNFHSAEQQAIASDNYNTCLNIFNNITKSKSAVVNGTLGIETDISSPR